MDDSPPPSPTTRAWPLQAVLGAALMLVLSIGTAIIPQINRVTDAEIPWFPIPMLGIGLLAVVFAQKRYAKPSVAFPWFHPIFFALVAIACLTALGILLTGWDAIKSGHASLFGDFWKAPQMFQNAYSISLVTVEALTEEASMRGVVQLPITNQLGSIRAQIVTGALFIVLHAITRSGIGEFTFVGATTIICGWLTALYRSIWPSAIVHAAANALLVLIVLVFRT
jgi:membrane protease YdiL (CAAX protease family)